MNIQQCKKLVLFFSLCGFHSMCAGDIFSENEITATGYDKGIFWGNEPIDVVIPVHEKDTRTLDDVISGIRSHCKNVRRVITVSAAPYTDQAEWFDESLYPFSKHDIATMLRQEVLHNSNAQLPRLGWIYQQLLKLYAPLVIPDISTNVLMVDADTIFLNDVEFIDADGHALYATGDEYHKPYFEHMKNLFLEKPLKRVFEQHSGIANHMLFQKDVIQELFRLIEQDHGQEAWKVLVQHISPKQMLGSGISEYEIYFNFIFSRYSHVKLRPLSWKRSRYSRGSIEHLRSTGTHFVSFDTFIDEPCIAFVHIGTEIPAYLYHAIKQARYFNHTCAIYLLANESALEKAPRDLLTHMSVTKVPLESLKKTEEHIDFLNTANLDRRSLEGFWFFTSERFLYLHDFAQQHGIKDIIHLENDVMLYVDAHEIFEKLRSVCGQIGVVLDNDRRCIPGFVYLSGAEATKKIARCFAKHAREKKVDMEVMALLFHEYKNSPELVVGNLPIIMPSYIQQFELKSDVGHKTDKPERYCNAIDQFKAIFDAAAIGQYLGGISPRNGIAVPGFINESCLFNVSRLSFEWRFDRFGRRIPYALFNGEAYRIFNLHIHSKLLEQFLSINWLEPETAVEEPDQTKKEETAAPDASCVEVPDMQTASCSTVPN